jgi:hypothetical protein
MARILEKMDHPALMRSGTMHLHSAAVSAASFGMVHLFQKMVHITQKAGGSRSRDEQFGSSFPKPNVALYGESQPGIYGYKLMSQNVRHENRAKVAVLGNPINQHVAFTRWVAIRCAKYRSNTIAVSRWTPTVFKVHSFDIYFAQTRTRTHGHTPTHAFKDYT